MMGKHNSTGYSADVRIWLACAGFKVPLSHSSSTFIIAKHPIDLPPGEAQIVFTVDDEQYTRPITLVNGMSKNQREAMVLGRDIAIPF